MIVTDAVSDYLAGLRPPSDSVLAEMEEHGRRDGIPIVVPETGRLLEVLALTRGARRIVEVGTAIGVSTLYLARGLAPGGKIISFEVDEERHNAARDYLQRAGVGDRCELHLEDARTGLAALQGPFDLAFIDGVKAQYGQYFGQLLPLLGPGSLLAIDNVLMSGTVAENRSDGHWTEEQIAMMREFSRALIEDESFTATVTPVGDGMLLAVSGEPGA
jgi:predicted O-methyltransferase YrrM